MNATLAKVIPLSFRRQETMELPEAFAVEVREEIAPQSFKAKSLDAAKRVVDAAARKKADAEAQIAQGQRSLAEAESVLAAYSSAVEALSEPTAEILEAGKGVA